VVIIAIAADQGSKFLVERSMALGQSISVLGDFFRLTFIRNAGGAFGIFLGGGWFYLAASVVAIVLIFLYLARVSSAQILPRISLAMILGGALGNLVDRVRSGEVTDFLDFGVGRLRWPVFNLADAFVTVGVIFFLLTMLRGREGGSGHPQEINRSSAN
jgi:signal peptidase II